MYDFISAAQKKNKAIRNAYVWARLKCALLPTLCHIYERSGLSTNYTDVPKSAR